MLSPKNINSHILAALGTMMICAIMWGSFQLNLNLNKVTSPVISDDELDELLQHFENFELESPLSPEMPITELGNNAITESEIQTSISPIAQSSNSLVSQVEIDSPIKNNESLPIDTVLKKIEVVKVLEVDTVKLIPKNVDVVATIRENTRPKSERSNTDEKYKRELENYNFYKKNYRNIRYFKIVYPYALKTREIINDLNERLAQTDDKAIRKEMIPEMEDQLFKEYETAVRKMSISQGKLLLKLIARETDKTGYEIIKEYRGGFSAAFWYGVGRIFGTDLKTEFNKETEDSIIEIIVEKYKNAEL